MHIAKILKKTLRADPGSARELSLPAGFTIAPCEKRDPDLKARLAAVRQIVSGRIVFTTSFGIEDQAIAHAIFSQDLAVDVVALDSGRLFPETYEVWARTEQRYGARIVGVYPDHVSVESLIARQGINGFYASIGARHACCAVRKAEPLRRALAGATVWITGLRADQSDDHTGISFAVVAPRHRVIKVNPLFDWTRDQVLAFIGRHSIPYHPLHDQGFAWIGCAPCTRAIAQGEREHTARWWWEGERQDSRAEQDHAGRAAPYPETRQTSCHDGDSKARHSPAALREGVRP